MVTRPNSGTRGGGTNRCKFGLLGPVDRPEAPNIVIPHCCLGGVCSIMLQLPCAIRMPHFERSKRSLYVAVTRKFAVDQLTSEGKMSKQPRVASLNAYESNGRQTTTPPHLLSVVDGGAVLHSLVLQV